MVMNVKYTVEIEPITLGKFIALLEREPTNNTVRFDFGYFRPTSVSSYRGYYDQLAVEYVRDEKEITVKEFISVLRSAIDRVFEGYKGGDFKMDCDTPLWAANQGDSNSTAIVGIAECSCMTIIHTAWCE